MRVLHTADLHLGRDSSGFSRREEQERFVTDIIDAARTEAVDLTVIAGDIFDSANPPAWAEDAFYALLDGLSDGGRRAVLVIAGNHDQSVRLAAADPLARRLGIMLLGHRDDVPYAFDETGRVRIEPLGAGTAIVRGVDRSQVLGVAALPFTSEVALTRRVPGGPVPNKPEDRDAYGRALAALFAERRALLPADIPSMLVGHLWVSGGHESGSERLYRLAAFADLPAKALPQADYVALGHLHDPQQLGDETPVIYPGSPIAYTATEAGQRKRAVLVELQPHRAAVLKDIPLTCGRPVEAWEAGSLDELRVQAEAARARRPFVALKLDIGRQLARAERDELNALGIDFLSIDVLETAPLAATSDPHAPTVSDEELLRAFVEHELQAGADESLVSELLRLLAESGGTEPVSEAA